MHEGATTIRDGGSVARLFRIDKPWCGRRVDGFMPVRTADFADPSCGLCAVANSLLRYFVSISYSPSRILTQTVFNLDPLPFVGCFAGYHKRLLYRKSPHPSPTTRKKSTRGTRGGAGAGLPPTFACPPAPGRHRMTFDGGRTTGIRRPTGETLPPPKVLAVRMVDRGRSRCGVARLSTQGGGLSMQAAVHSIVKPDLRRAPTIAP